VFVALPLAHAAPVITLSEVLYSSVLEDLPGVRPPAAIPDVESALVDPPF
jgi:hypothetical protein